MKDNIFIKKLGELGSGAVRTVEKYFGGVVKSADELVDKFKNMSAKTRLKLVKQVGAGFMSLLILCGFSGCLNNKGEIENDMNSTTSITLVATTKPDDGEQTKPEDGEQSKPSEGEQTKPNEGEENKPSDGEQTKPSEGEQNKPSEGEGNKPSEGEKPPVEVEDLPGDADGYAYPNFFKDKVHEVVVLNGALANNYYYNYIKEVEPEILYVDRTTNTKIDDTGICVYAKFDLTNMLNYEKVIYARFVFDITDMKYLTLGKAAKFNSYAEYVDLMQQAIQEKNLLLDAKVSEIYETDKINDELTETFAKFVDEKFVDANVMFVRWIDGEKWFTCEISGFAYDRNNNAYQYIMQVLDTDSVSSNGDDIIYDINNAVVTRQDMEICNITTKAMDSVYTKQTQEVKE